MDKNFIYSVETKNIPLNIKDIFIDYLDNDCSFSYKIDNNNFIIESSSVKKIERLKKLIYKISKSETFFDSILCFDELNYWDIFRYSNYLPIETLLPYLEELENRGIVFNFIEFSDYAIEGNQCVDFISKEEFKKRTSIEEINFFAWMTKYTSVESEKWLTDIGFNYIEKNLNLSKDELSHIIDYLNSFDYRRGIFEELFAINDLDYKSFKNKLNTLDYEKKAALKSSYSELLVKANDWMVRESKRLDSIEDWSGIREVFKTEIHTVYHLLSNKSKDRESKTLKHCVGLGGYDYCSGIYSIRNKKNKPLATIEVSKDFEIIQIQGEANRKIKDVDVLKTIARFFKEHIQIDLSNSLEIHDTTNTPFSFIHFPMSISCSKTNEKILLTGYDLILDDQIYFFDSFVSVNLKADGSWQDEMSRVVRMKFPESEEKVLKEIQLNKPFILTNKILNIKLKKEFEIFSPFFKKISNFLDFYNKNKKHFKNYKKMIAFEIKKIKDSEDFIQINKNLRSSIKKIESFFTSKVEPLSHNKEENNRIQFLIKGAYDNKTSEVLKIKDSYFEITLPEESITIHNNIYDLIILNHLKQGFSCESCINSNIPEHLSFIENYNYLTQIFNNIASNNIFTLSDYDFKKCFYIYKFDSKKRAKEILKQEVLFIINKLNETMTSMNVDKKLINKKILEMNSYRNKILGSETDISLKNKIEELFTQSNNFIQNINQILDFQDKTSSKSKQSKYVSSIFNFWDKIIV